MSTLRKGSAGAEVRELQKLLNLSGAGLTIDGDFGTKTEKAVIKFQSDNGLDPDGICGPLTWDKLKTQPTNAIRIINECVADIMALPSFGKFMELIENDGK